ncbi:MAG: hypothetical protein ABUR63_02925, partial [Verrucomicrobiota bacterium]
PAAVGGVAAPADRGNGKRRRRKRRREVRPPERRCDDCLAFLTDRKTKEIPCTGCKTPIHWPPESQLQTHLGNWAEPSLCGACKRDLTEAARVAEREALRHAATAGIHLGSGKQGDGAGDSGPTAITDMAQAEGAPDRSPDAAPETSGSDAQP